MAQEQAQIAETQALRDTFAGMVAESNLAPAAPVAPPAAPEPISTPAEPASTPTIVSQTPAEPAKTQSFEEMLAERSGGKYKSLEDIKPEIKEITKEPEFKNDFLKKMYEYTEKNGGDTQEFLKIHSTNWEQVGADALIKEQMKAENPKLTPEQLEKLYDYTYKQSDNYSDDDREIGAIRLTSDAEKVREAKIKFQQENTIPKNVRDEQVAQTVQAEKQALWEKSVAEELKDTKISHKVALDKDGVGRGMEVSVDHVLDENEMKQMSSTLNNPNAIFQKYIDKAGNVDMKTLKKDMFMLNNLDKVLAKTAENAVSQFIKKDLKNANFNPAATVPSAEPNLKQEAEKRLANYLSI